MVNVQWVEERKEGNGRDERISKRLARRVEQQQALLDESYSHMIEVKQDFVDDSSNTTTYRREKDSEGKRKRNGVAEQEKGVDGVSRILKWN